VQNGYAASGDWQEATTAQMRLNADSYEESNLADDYGIKLSKDALALNRQLAEIYLSSGEFTSALSKYNMLISYDWNTADKAELIAKKGACHEGLKQYDMALKSYLESREMQPKNPAYAMNLACVYDETGMESQAMVEYRKVIELGGDRFTAALALGRIYEGMGLFSMAVEYYSQALMVKSSLQIYGALARCYEASSKWDLASSMLKQEMSGMPDAPPVESMVHLSYLYSIQGKYDDALKTLLEAKERDRPGEEITANLCAIYFKKGDYMKARETVNGYIAQNPSSPLAYFLDGFMDYFEGKKGSAAGKMTKALALNPTPMLGEYARQILSRAK
jgi:tetratricopeptide (TPR) repeat protein